MDYKGKSEALKNLEEGLRINSRESTSDLAEAQETLKSDKHQDHTRAELLAGEVDAGQDVARSAIDIQENFKSLGVVKI